MKIEKAIEILELNALEPGSYLPPDYITALKLGIEALKRTKAQQASGAWRDYPKLPGEDS